MTFKPWLDAHVVPLLGPGLAIHSFFWDGPADAPTQVLVFLTAQGLVQLVPLPRTPTPPEPDLPFAGFEELADHLAATEVPTERVVLEDAGELWCAHVKRLLEVGFRFDYLREQVLVKTDTGVMPIFGGDGAPIFGKNGMVSVRLWKRMGDGKQLILQVGNQCKTGLDAAQLVKGFFGAFEEDPVRMVQKYAAPFGAA